MGKLNLYRKDPPFKGRTRNCYRISESPLNFCEKAMNIPGFVCTEIRLTLDGEEMMPSKRVGVFSFNEIIKYDQEEEISSCFFVGHYQDNLLDIVVDFALNSVFIASDSLNVIEIIENELSS